MKSNQPSLAVNANDMEDEIFADLAMRFANRPLYRHGFAIEETGMEVLLKQFADKVCRVYRWRNHAGIRSTEAVLRFDEFAFVFIQNRYSKHVRIYCDTAEKAVALEKQLRDVLPPPVKKPDEPWFYMLRKDDDGFSIEKIVNKSAQLKHEGGDRWKPGWPATVDLKAVMTTLVQALDDPDEMVRYFAVCVLMEATGNPHYPSVALFEGDEQDDLDQWKSWARNNKLGD